MYDFYIHNCSKFEIQSIYNTFPVTHKNYASLYLIIKACDNVGIKIQGTFLCIRTHGW